MGFGVAVPVVGGGVAERERESQWGKVIEIRNKRKREIILYFFYCIIYIILICTMVT